MMNSLTVSELTAYIKQLVDSDMLLSNVTVTGEISNFKLHSSGHMYFSLKDSNAVIKCVMFRTYNMRMRFMPEEGMKVIVRGYVSVYPPGGTYQLYAEEMQPDGTGSLYLAFEQLKRRLEAQGWFAQEHKKPIPKLPRAIGIVTSPTGAVIRDMLNILQRRYPNVRVIIYPSPVQGSDAAPQLAAGIRYFNERKTWMSSSSAGAEDPLRTSGRSTTKALPGPSMNQKSLSSPPSVMRPIFPYPIL
jgi:Exodeoxyribonuclease VII large subunit (EC 3.1.11.6)